MASPSSDSLPSPTRLMSRDYRPPTPRLVSSYEGAASVEALTDSLINDIPATFSRATLKRPAPPGDSPPRMPPDQKLRFDYSKRCRDRYGAAQPLRRRSPPAQGRRPTSPPADVLASLPLADPQPPIAEDIVNDLSEYHLVYWAETRTVVCTKCTTPTLLWQANASSHWRINHRQDTFAPTRNINTLLGLLPDVAKRDSDVSTPKFGLPPRSFLSPPQPGFQCPCCLWASPTQKKMREHIRRAHPNEPSNIAPLATLVQSQGRSKPLWFAVRASGSNNDPSPPPRPNNLYVSAVESLASTRQAHIDDLKQRVDTQETPHRSEMTTWSKLHGLSPYVQAQGRPHLIHLLRRAETPLEVALDKVNAQLWDHLAATFDQSPFYARHVVTAPRRDVPITGKPPLKSVSKYSTQAGHATRFLVRQHLAPCEDRPRPHFTDRQSQCLEALQTWLTPNHPAPRPLQRWASHPSGNDAARRSRCPQNAVVALELFLLSLFDQPCEASTTGYTLGRYLAAQTISAGHSVDRPVKHYTTLLPSLLYLARSLVLSNSVALFPDRTEECIAYLKKTADAWLRDDSLGVVQDILRLLAVGLKISEKTPSLVNFTIVENDTAIQFADKLLPLDDLRAMPYSLVNQARDHLVNHLLFDPTVVLPTGPELSRIIDDLAEERLGFYFGDTPGAQSLGNHTNVIAALGAITSPPAGLITSLPDGTAKFPTTALGNYQHRCKLFLEIMIVLIVMTAGLPPRATELASIRVYNYQRPRNIFLIDGQLMIAIEYNKNNSQRLSENKVVRFLPFPVAQLLIKYICCCHSFLCYLAEVSNPYLFAELQTERSPSATSSGTLSVRRKARPDPFDLLSSSPPASDDEAPDAQATAPTEAVPEGRKPAPRHRPDSWLYTLFPRIMQERLPVPVSFRDWRQIIIAIDRHFLHIFDQDHAAAQLFAGDPDGTRGQLDGQPSVHEQFSAAQSGHNVVTHQRHYNSSLVANVRHLDSRTRSMFAQLSAALHAWYHHLSPSSPTPINKPFKPQRPAAAKSLEAPPSLVLPKLPRLEWPWGSPESFPRPTGEPPSWASDERIQVALTALYSTSPEQAPSWRSPEQRQALDIIVRMKRRQRLFVILPTGGGKSLLYQVPALLNVSCTVVIVLPFTALMLDARATFQRMGMSCETWSKRMGESAPLPKVILISGEAGAGNRFYRARCSNSSPSFVNWARTMASQLSYIFLDEVHVPLANSDYRDLGGLRDIFTLGVPTVAMTATLPPSCYDAMRDLFTSRALEGAMLFRTWTDRPNLQYSVMHYSLFGEDMLGLIHELVSWEIPDHTRTVVYTRTTNDADLAVRFLNDHRPASRTVAVAYHNSLASRDTKTDQENLAAEKAASLQRWLRGQVPLIVATSALGTGVDLRAVRAVCHVSTAHQFLEQIQQMGRAGRDGVLARCVTFTPPPPSSNDSRATKARKRTARRRRDKDNLAQRHKMLPGDVNAEEEYLTGGPHGCRRAAIIRYTDGIDGMTCFATSGVLCDLCAARQRKAFAEAANSKAFRRLTVGPMDQFLTKPTPPVEHSPPPSPRVDTDRLPSPVSSPDRRSPSPVSESGRSNSELSASAWPPSSPRTPPRATRPTGQPRGDGISPSPPRLPSASKGTAPARSRQSSTPPVHVLVPASTSTPREPARSPALACSAPSIVAATVFDDPASSRSPPTAIPSPVTAGTVNPEPPPTTRLPPPTAFMEDIASLLRDAETMQWSDHLTPVEPATRIDPTPASTAPPHLPSRHQAPSPPLRQQMLVPPRPALCDPSRAPTCVEPQSPADAASSPSTRHILPHPPSGQGNPLVAAMSPPTSSGSFVVLADSSSVNSADVAFVALDSSDTSLDVAKLANDPSTERIDLSHLPEPEPDADQEAPPSPETMRLYLAYMERRQAATPRKRSADDAVNAAHASKRIAAAQPMAIPGLPMNGQHQLDLASVFAMTSSVPAPQTQRTPEGATQMRRDLEAICERSRLPRTHPVSPLRTPSVSAAHPSLHPSSSTEASPSLTVTPHSIAFPRSPLPPTKPLPRAATNPRPDVTPAAVTRRPLADIRQGRSSQPCGKQAVPFAKNQSSLAEPVVRRVNPGMSSSPSPAIPHSSPIVRAPSSSRLSRHPPNPSSPQWSRAPSSSASSTSTVRLQARQILHRTVTDMLDPLRGQCMIHVYENLSAGPSDAIKPTHHDMFDDLRDNPSLLQEWTDFKGSFHYVFTELTKAGSPAWCHKCHIPYDLCHKTSEERRCRYNDIVVPFLFMWTDAVDEEGFLKAVATLPAPLCQQTKSSFDLSILGDCPTGPGVPLNRRRPFSWLLFSSVYEQLQLNERFAQDVRSARP